MAALQEFYTEVELASELERSVPTLRRWRKAGSGPPWGYGYGRRVLYAKARVGAWLTAKTKGNASRTSARKRGTR